MAATTEIGWTDATFNPWIGCARVSPGCLHCYAEARDRRVGDHLWGVNAPRRRTTPANWRGPLKWDRNAAERGAPSLVFCASLADVFEDRDDLDEHRADLFELMESTTNLRWQVLTKRPENVLGMVPPRWLTDWPAHVWLGTTVEDQQRADERIPELLAVPARVRFLSCEPLLGPLDLSAWLGLEWMETLRAPGEPESFRGDGGWGMDLFAAIARSEGSRPWLQWVIVGGESGPGFRAMRSDDARDLCAQVLAAEVPLFFKQWGGIRPTAGGDTIDVIEGLGELTYKRFPAEALR